MVDAVARADHDKREALLAIVDGEIVGLAEWGRVHAGDRRRPTSVSSWTNATAAAASRAS